MGVRGDRGTAPLFDPRRGVRVGTFYSVLCLTLTWSRDQGMTVLLPSLVFLSANSQDYEYAKEEMMLGETQDWLMLMRFAPVQYPG